MLVRFVNFPKPISTKHIQQPAARTSINSTTTTTTSSNRNRNSNSNSNNNNNNISNSNSNSNKINEDKETNNKHYPMSNISWNTHQPPPTFKSKACANSKPKPVEISRHCSPRLSSVSLLHSNVHLRLASSGVGAILVCSEPFGLWEKKAARRHCIRSDSGQASACILALDINQLRILSDVHLPCTFDILALLPFPSSFPSKIRPSMMTRLLWELVGRLSAKSYGENVAMHRIEHRTPNNRTAAKWALVVYPIIEYRGFIGQIGLLSTVSLYHQLLTQSPTLEGSNRGALQTNSSFWSE